jgi:hypothetical protein
MAHEDETTGVGGRSAVLRAAAAAAATSAAAYGVQRLRAGREGRGGSPVTEDAVERDGDERGAGGKRQELTQALTSKAAEAKHAASRLTPGGGPSSSIESAWEALSPYLLRLAREAASSLGAAVAGKAPELVREELMPRFIEGFENAS